jgi:hypothetical protein
MQSRTIDTIARLQQAEMRRSAEQYRLYRMARPSRRVRRMVRPASN